MKKQIITLMLGILLSLNLVFAASISLSLGSYSSEIYTQETVSVPVIITASNITGNVDVTLSPKSGLTCSTCTLSASFSGSTTEQKTVTFTLTGSQTGNYNPPFVSVSALSGSTSATPLTSGDRVTVVEKPTWIKDFSASDTTPEAGDEITLTLEIVPSGTFEGVSADLTLTGGLTRVSGSDPRTIGIISGTSTYQWVVSAASSGTARVALSATSPYESGSSNTESVTITVAGDDEGNDNGSPGGGSSGGAGGTITGATYIVSEIELAGGYSKAIEKGAKFSFKIKNESHTVTLDSFSATSASITVASTPQKAILAIGEEKKFELTSDNIYDLSVRLDSVNMTANKTSFTIKAIQEAGAEPVSQSPPVQTNPTTDDGDKSGTTDNDGNKVEKDSSPIIMIIVGIVILIAIIIGTSFMMKGKKKR